MFDIFDSIKALLKLEKVCIDNNVFRLHYKVTVNILVAFSILVNSRQYFGDPIDCTRNPLTENVIDNYCWMHSYILEGDDTNTEIASYGVRPNKPSSDQVHYHRYYQWIGFILFLQAILFFFPRYLWRYCWEEGKIKALVGSLHSPIQESQEEVVKRQNLIIDYIIKNQGYHKVYAAKFFFCEFLNFLNVIGQLYLVNTSLGKAFTTFGLQVFSFITNPKRSLDPMEKIFPKTARCTFNYFGHGGGLEKFHAVCVLPVNMFNEKVYIFLWFYFILLAVITTLAMLYRMTILCSRITRRFLLCRLSKSTCFDTTINKISESCDIGDWFLLYQVGKNIDPLIFGNLMCNLERRFTVEKLMDSVFVCENYDK